MDKQSIFNHTIIEKAVSVLGLVDGKITLSESGKFSLKDALSSCFGKAELKQAVTALIVFAFFLEHEKSAPEAASHILDVVQTARDPLQLQCLFLEDIVSSVTHQKEVKKILGQIMKQPGQKTEENEKHELLKWWEIRKSEND